VFGLKYFQIEVPTSFFLPINEKFIKSFIYFLAIDNSPQSKVKLKTGRQLFRKKRHIYRDGRTNSIYDNNYLNYLNYEDIFSRKKVDRFKNYFDLGWKDHRPPGVNTINKFTTFNLKQNFLSFIVVLG
jgi:hypothetical protein